PADKSDSNPTRVTEKPKTSPVTAQLAALPLAFETNAGQTDQSVDFLTRGDGYGLFLTDGSAVLQLGTGGISQVVRLDLLGHEPKALVSGVDLLPGQSNYLKGSYPSQWLTGIKQYGNVLYHDVYDGVDLRYYGNQRQLEYDFIINPNEDPEKIQLAFQG